MTSERLIYALRAHLLNPDVAPTPDVASAVAFADPDRCHTDDEALSFFVQMGNRDFRVVVSDITPDRSEEQAALDEYLDRFLAGEIDLEDDEDEDDHDPPPRWTWER